jgi:hypothetical protein
VVVKDGLIAGLALSGDIEKAGILYNLMKDRVNVGSFKEALVTDDFGLASLPEAIWQAWLATPTPELTSLARPAEEPEEAVIGE